MDGITFDHLTKRFTASTSSRRGLLRLGVGGGLGLLVFGQMAEEALACRRNKKPCDKTKPNGNCCSGTCRKGTCRPTKGAAGCQVNSGDICKNQFIPCPQNPDGVCALLDNGRPFCVAGAVCEACTANADCTSVPNGKCIKTCPHCGVVSPIDQACVYPAA